jgi:RNA 2',3'-cyclic 3'-phosphodiesterase
MRLFTGIELPVEIKSRLRRLLDTLRPTARIKWSPVGNLHVTTKFIGEWPDERVDELVAALHALAPRAAVHIAVRNLGWFPNPSSPRVFWAGLDAGPGLAELARETERSLEPLGVAVEGRAYSPHLTLARIKEPVSLTALRDAVETLAGPDFGQFLADRFFLYQSTLNPNGAEYLQIAEFPFQQP